MAAPAAATKVQKILVGRWRNFASGVFRKKSPPDVSATPLKRCLNFFDLTLMGIGNMVGAGIYVLTGTEARQTSGPGIFVAYILSGILSCLTALCYAEMGARIPRTGTTYAYAFVTLGEAWAFIIGWNMITGGILGSAAVAKSMSNYLWAIFRHSPVNSTSPVPLFTDPDSSNLSLSDVSSETQYHLFDSSPDWVAICLIFAVTCFVATGVRTSTNFNSLFACINLCVIGLVIVYGGMLADIRNWTDVKGGFMPFGVSGVVASGATCFLAYAGYDAIATAGEETKNPGRDIPIATLLAMGIVMACYCAMSAVLTLMVPYYHIDPNAAFAEAFAYRGAFWAKYVISVGAVAGMTTALIGCIYGMPRLIYVIAQDGLIFKPLGYVQPQTQVPLTAVVVSSILIAVTAAFIRIEPLIPICAIGGLLGYSIVSASVVILRYQPATTHSLPERQVGERSCMQLQSSDLNENEYEVENKTDIGGNLKNEWLKFVPMKKLCGKLAPGLAIKIAIGTITASAGIIGTIIGHFHTSTSSWWTALLLAASAYVAVLALAVICMHHESNRSISYKLPFMPLLPMASVAINIVLVAGMDSVAWVRYAVLIAIGAVIYVFEGCRRSQVHPAQ